MLVQAVACEYGRDWFSENVLSHHRLTRYKFEVGIGLTSPAENADPAPCYNVSSAAAAGRYGRVVCSDWSGCGAGAVFMHSHSSSGLCFDNVPLEGGLVNFRTKPHPKMCTFAINQSTSDMGCFFLASSPRHYKQVSMR